MTSPAAQVRVPAGLLARIDERRGDQSRADWIAAACDQALDHVCSIRLTASDLPSPRTEVLTYGRRSREDDQEMWDRLARLQAECPHPPDRARNDWCGRCGNGLLDAG